MSDKTMTKRYLTERDVAELLQISKSKLQKDRQKRIGIRVTQFGRCIRYDWDDVMAFMAENRVETSHVL